MSTSIVEEKTTGAASISDEAIKKIFFGELELMISIRRMIDSSSLSTARKMGAKLIQKSKLDLVRAGMREALRTPKSKFKGPARARVEIQLCENYFMILDTLLDEQANATCGAQTRVLGMLKTAWEATKKSDPDARYTVNTPAEEALQSLFEFAWMQDIRFSRLHSQLTAHLALVEYRMKNGWLLGKYDGQWTKKETDSEIVHNWVGVEGMNLCMPAYRLNIPQVHAHITGKSITGM